MYQDANTVEFSGQRSDSYKDALSTYGNAWRADLACMRRFLNPQPGHRILEVGAGNGYFSRAISNAVGPTGLLVASDPSVDQLSELELGGGFDNVRVIATTADELTIGLSDFDAVWSRGAIHHVFDKTSAFRRFAEVTRPGGLLVIADIFAGTRLAHYFDSFIARSCITGHEVAYLSHDFAASLCSLTGWEPPTFHEVITPWEFARKEDIGAFLHALFAAKDTYTAQDCLEAADEFLSVTETTSGWALMWPMTVMVAKRAQMGV